MTLATKTLLRGLYCVALLVICGLLTVFIYTLHPAMTWPKALLAMAVTVFLIKKAFPNTLGIFI